MGFFDKLKGGFKKIKKRLIVYLVVIVVVSIVGVAPFNVSVQEGLMAQKAGDNFWAVFFTQLFRNIQKPFNCLGQCFTQYFLAYLNTLKWYLLLCGVFVIIGIIKNIPKHEYQDIENGSSDWCENGEQYAVLNKKEGIILAEKNYLPVDKRGNVNVLVVRRFWCW